MENMQWKGRGEAGFSHKNVEKERSVRLLKIYDRALHFFKYRPFYIHTYTHILHIKHNISISAL